MWIFSMFCSRCKRCHDNFIIIATVFLLLLLLILLLLYFYPSQPNKTNNCTAECGLMTWRCRDCHLSRLKFIELSGRLNFVDDLHVRRHIVFARKLLEAVRTWIHFHISLVRRDIVPAEVADVGINA